MGVGLTNFDSDEHSCPLPDMINSSDLHLRPADNLLQLDKTRFYPLNIPVPHNQLRHFISTVEQDWIYYAESYDIYAIHLPSQRRSLLVTIPFIPRCLSAGLGWICLGGENHGDVAFIKLSDESANDQTQIDAPLPVDLPRTSKRTPPPRPGDVGYGIGACPELIIQELGGDIVNAVTIHALSNEGTSTQNESIVMISNNDMSVKMYSLSQRKLIADLMHPVPMNYAVVSPDSEVLVAVGDGDQAFCYHRKRVSPKSFEGSSLNAFPRYDWQLFATPKIPIDDRLVDDHSFSIAFSSSGDLCAVSSQGGVITVFDLEALNMLGDNDNRETSSICYFRSSRSGVIGCVRSMAFSPAPWDLLVWAEDHGRVGIADIKQGFCRRQIVRLETHAVGLERIKIEDVTHSSIKALDTKGRLIHQYRQRTRIDINDAEGPTAGRPFSLSEDELLARQNRDNELLYNTGLDLDERERSILNTLEVTMDEIYEASANPVNRPYSVNYRSSPRERASLGNEESVPSPTSLDGGRNRSGDRSYLPRRQSSVVLSRSNTSAPATSRLTPQVSARSRLTASPSRMPHADDESDDADLPPLMSANDLTPTSHGSDTQPLPNDIPPSHPWHVIQSALEPALATTRGTEPMSSDSATNLSQSEAPLAVERQDSITSTTRPLPAPSAPSLGASWSAAFRTAASSDHQERQQYMRNELRSHRQTLLQQSLELQRSRNQRQPLLPRSIEVDSERQTTRPHSNVPSTESRESATRSLSRLLDDDRHRRILEARALARQRGAASNGSVNVATSTRNNSGRRSDLSGRVTTTDINLARLMITSGARNMIDRNGNWVTGEAFDQLSGVRGVPNVTSAPRTTAASDVAREVGVGTAGVGWSPDGRSLYVGTTEGIFEYAVNLADRKTFPALAFQ